MKINKKIIAPVCAILAMSSLGISATYALFTSQSSSNIAVTSGKVNVTSTLSNLKTYSGINLVGDPQLDTNWTDDLGGAFSNGGSASIADNVLTLDRIVPGDKVTFDLTTKNESNVSIKWRFSYKAVSDNGLIKGLKVTLNGVETSVSLMRRNNDWVSAADPCTDVTNITIELPSNCGNEYQNKNCSIKFMVEAVQGNAKTYDTDFEIANSEELVAFRDEVNGGKDFKNQIVALTNNIDLADSEWVSIGTSEKPFKGIFDGFNHEIKDFKFTGTEVNNGLFGYAEDFTIKNLSLKDVDLNPTGGTTSAFLLGHANKSGTIENVVIDESCSALSASKYLAGLVCYAPYASLHFLNCTNNGDLESTGSTGYRVGGFVCQLGTSDGTSVFENCANSGKVIANKNGTPEAGWAGGFISQKVAGSSYLDILKEARISFINCNVVSNDIKGDHAGAYFGNRTYELVEFKNSKVDNNNIVNPKGLVGYNEGSASFAINETIYLAKNTHANDDIDVDILYYPFERKGYGATSLEGKYQKVTDAKYSNNQVQFLDGAAFTTTDFYKADNTKIQRGKYVAGWDNTTSQYIYKINIWLVANNDKPDNQEITDPYVGTVNYFDNLIITSGAYFDDPTDCVDLSIYDVTHTGNIYYVTAK